MPTEGLPLAAYLVDVAFQPRKELELNSVIAVLSDAVDTAVLLVPAVADNRVLAMILV